MTSLDHSPNRLAFASALLLWSASAAAREPATVALYTSTCSPKEDSALRQALEVELRAMRIEPRLRPSDAAGPPARFTLRAECDVENDSVALRLWSSEPELVLARLVALRDVDASARARTLALVISEAIGPALASSDDLPASGLPPRGAPRAAVEAGGLSLDASAGGDDRGSDAAANGAPFAAGGADPSGAGAESAAPARRARPRRGSGLNRENPYGALDDLYSTESPYGMARGFRIGALGQGRLALRDSSVLVGLELGTNGPLSDSVDWAIELSHSSATAWTSDLDVSWWSSAIGFDFVNLSAVAIALGPRIAFGHLSINDLNPYDSSGERTLVTQLGFRSKLDVPVGERTSVQMTFSGHGTVGVYALTSYTGLDEGLNGWVLSWGLGLGLEP